MMKNSSMRGGYIFLLPAAIIYLAVIAVPAFYSISLSFFKWNGVSPNMEFVALKNYGILIGTDPIFQHAVLNNIIWVLLTIILTVTVALFLANLLNRDFKGRTAFRGIFYFPYVLSGIVVGYIWTWVYHPQLGLLTAILDVFRFPHIANPPLANTNTALFAVFIAELWRGFGAPMILFLAGLQTIPKELFEAAKMDGANAFQTFFSIKIPMLRETFVIVFATQIISAMKVYGVIFAMTRGGPANSTHTMATYMINQTFIYTNVGKGTAIAVIMVVVLMFIIIPFVLFMAKD